MTLPLTAGLHAAADVVLVVVMIVAVVVAAKSAPGVYWYSVPLAQMSAGIREHIDDGVAKTLGHGIDWAHCKLDEKERLL